MTSHLVGLFILEGEFSAEMLVFLALALALLHVLGQRV